MLFLIRMACVFAWNSPNTLLGLLGAAGGRMRWRRGARIWEVTGGWLIALLKRQQWADAITLGDVVLYGEPELVTMLRVHEAVHVRQARVWGPLFLPAYCLEFLWQWRRTGDGYRNNRFERAAYNVSE